MWLKIKKTKRLLIWKIWIWKIKEKWMIPIQRQILIFKSKRKQTFDQLIESWLR